MSKLSDRIGQFTVIPNTVIRLLPVIGVDAFMLFVCLRYHSNEHDVSFPAYPKITEETTLSRNRIAKAIRALESEGLLIRKRRFSGSTIYTLIMPPISHETGLMDNAPLVPQQDDISHETGLSLVPQQDANQTHSTISIKQDPLKEYNNIFSDLTDEACVALYCETTGQFAMPNTTRMQNDIKIIRGSIERLGLEATRERMSAAWQWWKSCKAKKTGKPYSPYNTGWIDRLQDNDPLPAHIVAKDAQQGADGSFYA